MMHEISEKVKNFILDNFPVEPSSLYIYIYILDCPGIESLWGRDFAHLSRPALRPTQSPIQLVPGLTRG